MKIKFLADANFSRLIVRGVIRAEPAVDFLASPEAALEGVSDSQILAIAAHEQRILVTHDLKSMPAHFGRFLANAVSPGVILIAQSTSTADAIEALIRSTMILPRRER